MKIRPPLLHFSYFPDYFASINCFLLLFTILIVYYFWRKMIFRSFIHEAFWNLAQLILVSLKYRLSSLGFPSWSNYFHLMWSLNWSMSGLRSLWSLISYLWTSSLLYSQILNITSWLSLVLNKQKITIRKWRVNNFRIEFLLYGLLKCSVEDTFYNSLVWDFRLIMIP